MAKYTNGLALDAALAVIASASRLVVTAGQPPDLAGADAARLADIGLSADDFSLADAPGGGRRLLVAGQAGLVALANGVADHVALVDDAQARLLHVTTCPPQPLLAGTAISVDGWDLTIAGPL